MKSKFSIRHCMVIACLMFFASESTWGQESERAQGSTNPTDDKLLSQNGAGHPKIRKQTQLISVDFPGGTIAEYVDLIKKDADTINLVVTETASKLSLPKIALKKVPVDVAIKCIEQCFDTNRVRVHVGGEGEAVRFIQAEIIKRVEVDVVNIQHLINQKKGDRDDFLSAVETGLQMFAEGNSGLKIKLHEETGLLFLSGESHEIKLVQQIVAQLGGHSNNLNQGVIYGTPSSVVNPGNRLIYPRSTGTAVIPGVISGRSIPTVPRRSGSSSLNPSGNEDPNGPVRHGLNENQKGPTSIPQPYRSSPSPSGSNQNPKGPDSGLQFFNSPVDPEPSGKFPTRPSPKNEIRKFPSTPSLGSGAPDRR